MPDDSPHNEPHFTLPSTFFDCVVKDIPVDTWIRLLNSNLTLKAAILEGFTVPAGKLGRLLRQPHIIARLQRFIRSEESILDEILLIWGQEQLSTVAFLEMLDRDFVLDNWQGLKSFVGPERFFAGLHVLGYLEDKEFRKLIDEGFWERRIEVELPAPIIPFRDLWSDFVRQFPQAKNWLQSAGLTSGGEAKRGWEEVTEPSREQLHRLEERSSKLQVKLNKAEEEKSQLHQEVSHYHKELEELRKRLAEREKTRDQEMRNTLARMRLEWFQRYQTYDRSSLDEANGLLESILRRTERAFDLQRQADEEYGLVAAVRQKLLQVELFLKEIERIYSESLVVHSEVTRSKDALLQAKEKLLRLPGIQKVLKQDPRLLTAADIRRRIRLLDAVPENLSKIAKLQTLLSRFVDLGLLEEPQAVFEDVAHKKRQIMENLYAQYQTVQEQQPQNRFPSLEDFVKSRESRKYDVYVDGYNILLKVQGKDRASSPLSLTALREQFTETVVRKSQLFRKVYLIFDGQEDSRDRQGNTEIVYTDKNRGNTADTYIIEAIRKRKDRQVLLVTEDREIIRAVQDRLFAVVNPYDFYLFVHDLSFPPLPQPE